MAPLGWLGRKTSTQANGQTDGGDINIPDAFSKKRGDKYLGWNAWVNDLGPDKTAPSLIVAYTFAIPSQYMYFGCQMDLKLQILFRVIILKSWRDWMHLHSTTYGAFFSPKVLIFFMLLHKSICCRYSLEAPRRGASNEYPQHMFSWRNKKNIYGIPSII